jgi:predicted enzyme related to lactoylglutathione lyase
MSVSLATISYPVSDLARARAFYEALFDTIASHADQAEVRFDVGVSLQLVPDLRAAPPPREGVLLTWRVPDLDRAIAAAEKHGGGCVLRRETSATVTDPFGNYVALEHDAGASGRSSRA